MKSADKRPAGEAPGPKTTKLLGLFLAAALVVTAGCGSGESGRAGHTHIDRNNDGYCDEDGEPMPAAGSGSRYYYGGSGGYYGGYSGLPGSGGLAASQSGTPGHPAGISSGTAPHGGIGSSHAGGGG